MTIEYSYRRSSGGHMAHIVPKDGDGVALCGYHPKSPKTFCMKARARWTHEWSIDKEIPKENICAACVDAKKKAESKAENLLYDPDLFGGWEEF